MHSGWKISAIAVGALLAAGLATLAGCKSEDAPVAADSGPMIPRTALGGYLASRHAQQEHDYADATAFIDRSLAADPDNDGLIRRAFALRLSEGRVDEAAPLARRIVARDGQGGLAALTVLEQSIKSGDFTAAAKQAASVPRDGAQRYAVPLLLAWADAGRGQNVQASKDLTLMGETRGLGPLKDLHDTLIADVTGQTAKAEAGYRKLVAAEMPPTMRVAELAGNFYERNHRTAAARAVYESIVPIDDSDVARAGLARLDQGVVPPPAIASPADGAAEAFFDLAALLNQPETLDAGIVYARLALDLKPDFALTQLLLGEIREQQDQNEDALEIYAAIAPGSPFAVSGRLRTALVLDAMGRTDEAERRLEAMAAALPDRPQALVELGDILRAHSNFAEAAAAYDRAVQRLPRPAARDWRIFYSRGVAYERAGQWPRAEADLKHALELQPEQPLVLNYLGYTWIDKGVNIDDAVKMIRRAVELRPNDGYIVDSLGWAYYRLGDFRHATEVLERAIELLPEDPTINDHLGDVYWRNGRLAEARYQWRRALQFKPEAEEIKSIESKLDRGLAGQPEKS